MTSSREPTHEYVICVDNADYPASLELHKVYRTLADQGALAGGDIRVIDESGEDYLFPASNFVTINPPAQVRSSFILAAPADGSGHGLGLRAQQRELEYLAKQMYEEVFQRLEDPVLREVVRDRITVMFGPPMVRPDVAIVSFQGGAGDRSPSMRTWPPRLAYLDDEFNFGKVLRHQFRKAGLYETLEHRTVAMAACFPEAPSGEAALWARQTGPRAQWREFSSHWVRRMLRAMRPRVVLVLGKNASMSVDLEGRWRDEKRRDSDRHRVFGRAEIEGCPAIYCHHPSQGLSGPWAQECLADLGRVLRSQ